MGFYQNFSLFLQKVFQKENNALVINSQHGRAFELRTMDMLSTRPVSMTTYIFERLFIWDIKESKLLMLL